MKLNEREQLDLRVRESADLLAGIIGSAMDAIITIDDAQRIVLFNAAAERIFACPANEAIGTSVERFMPQRFRAGHSTRVRRFAESGLTNRTLQGLGTVWGLRATGEEFPIEAAISKVESGGERFFTVVIRDITERHRAEEAVRESEQRFQLVADSAPVLMWMSGTDKLCTYFNKTWLDFTGRSIEEELGNGWAEGVHPDDSRRCLDTYMQSFERREKFEIEYRLRRHDGEYRWILDIGAPRFNQDSSFAGYIGVAVDVTEHRRAEEARIRSVAIVESSDDAIIGTDASGTVTDWNKGAERLFGYVAGEAIRKNISFLAAADHLDESQGTFKRIMSGEVVKHHETVRQRKDGTQVEISLTASPIVDAKGRIVGVSGIAHDITQRKAAEKRLRESEERLRLAQSAARMGTFEWNIRTGVNIWTPELEAIYGLTPGSFGGTQAAFEKLVHPDDRGRVIELVDEGLKAGQPTKGEWRVIWPDRSLHWIAGRWQVLMNESGEPSRMVGVNVDITERKLTEHRLREYEKAVEGSEEMIVVVDRQYRYLIANRQFLTRHRTTREQVVGHFVHEVTNREAFDAVFKPKLDECFQGEVVRFESKHTYPDLGERDLSISYFPVEGPNGIDRAACVLQDITDRKQAEQALAGMTQKLIEAEEQERARIGRELHDDINQRLAMLALQLEQLQDEPSEVPSRLQELRKETVGISSDVQALSHELHSSKLEYLGVGAAMKSWCREFGERQKIELDFKNDVSSVLRYEVGVCLFRVLQEASHNAIKHSGAKRIEVQLAEQSNQVHLIVRDSGKGFDVKAAMQGHGLGLTSMRERVRLVNGTISIESKPMGGTAIHASVPFRQTLFNRQLGERGQDITGQT